MIEKILLIINVQIALLLIYFSLSSYIDIIQFLFLSLVVRVGIEEIIKYISAKICWLNYIYSWLIFWLIEWLVKWYWIIVFICLHWIFWYYMKKWLHVSIVIHSLYNYILIFNK